MTERVCHTVGELKKFLKDLPDDMLITSSNGESEEMSFCTNRTEICPIKHLEIFTGDFDPDLHRSIKENILSEYLTEEEICCLPWDDDCDLKEFVNLVSEILPAYEVDDDYLTKLKIYSRYPLVPENLLDILIRHNDNTGQKIDENLFTPYKK